MNDPRLEENLRALVPTVAGDWGDVVGRASRLSPSRTRRRFLVGALAAAALAAGAGTALAIGHEFFDWFSVSRVQVKAPTLPAAAPFISGQQVYLPGRAPQQLSAPLLAPLLGQDATLVVASGDGRFVAYHSWRDRTPLLLIHDTRTGRERLLARDAQTVAWREDGTIAYVQADGSGYRGGKAYLGRVMVKSPGGAADAWAVPPGAYEVLAWARDRLLVGVRPCLAPGCPAAPEPGVYELDRSGRLLRLPLARLAALSPDGRLALGRHDAVAGQDSPSPLVRLVELDSRRVVATLDLSRAAAAAGLRGPLPGSLQAANWRGSDIVGTFSGQDSALVFFSAGRDRLTVHEAIRVPADTLPGRDVGFGTPFFTDGDTHDVLVPIRTHQTAAVLACDRPERHCVLGQPLAVREWFSVVTNPSRPSRNE